MHRWLTDVKEYLFLRDLIDYKANPAVEEHDWEPVYHRYWKVLRQPLWKIP
jgi:hypothetical protein